MALTATQINQAKPKGKLYRLSDGRGLYLEVPANGSKRWRFRYRFGDKGKMLSLGVYPDVSLKQARDSREAFRSLLAQGIDPAESRRQEKEQERQQVNTFEAVARLWFDDHRPTWADSTADTIDSRLKKNVYPYIGSMPIREVGTVELRPVLERMADRGALELAHRVRRLISQIFQYAVANERADRDPAADLKKALPPVKAGKFAALTEPKDISGLLRAIDGYSGSPIVRCALLFSSLTFGRPGEIRHAEWSEIDLEASFEIADRKGQVKVVKHPAWFLPPEKMKGGKAHIVALSRQAVAVLEELRPLTGAGKFLFPCARSSQRPMSENTVTGALRRLGFDKSEMCAHGFRSMASTRLNEMNWNGDWIERQLAHIEQNKIRGAYNRAEFLEGRIKMMQFWADYLDSLREGGKVVPFPVKAS